MKKVLLAGTALLGMAVASTPAAAQIDLDVGGFTRFYGVYADNDETAPASLREFEFRRDVELHFTGEYTTDSGLTVGVHHELELGGNVTTDETYVYFSGNYGRVNLGSEDGAAYLLQVAAPSADSNVDGLRQYISGLNSPLWTAGTAGGAFAAGSAITLDYDHADFFTGNALQTDRFTYLTPKWNGFQAGFSYAPEPASAQGVVGMSADITTGAFEDLWELAARWDGEFEGFGISAGAGYSTASTEVAAAAGTPLAGGASDDLETWNAGLNVAFQGFSIGASYLTTNNGFQAAVAAPDADRDTWVVGAAWDNGPYHLGATYYNTQFDEGAFGTVSEVEIDRFTLGGGYTYGPGMSVRGAFSFGEADDGTVATTNEDFTEFTIGTDVKF